MVNDNISNGKWCAKKAWQIIENVEKIIAVEFMCAAQAIEFFEEMKPGAGTYSAYQTIWNAVPKLTKDRIIRNDIVAVVELIRNGALLDAEESAVT